MKINPCDYIPLTVDKHSRNTHKRKDSERVGDLNFYPTPHPILHGIERNCLSPDSAWCPLHFINWVARETV